MEKLVIMLLNVHIKKITKSLRMMKKKVAIEEMTLRKEGMIKIKGKRSLYYTKAHSSEEEDTEDSNEESLFLAIEEKYQECIIKSKENTALHAKVESRSWIIDSRCSNHMNKDKDKFIALEKYGGKSIKFVGEEAAPIYEIRSISINGYYAEGLRHSLLSVSHICNRGYEVVFMEIGSMIRKGRTRNLATKELRQVGMFTT